MNLDNIILPLDLPKLNNCPYCMIISILAKPNHRYLSVS